MSKLVMFIVLSIVSFLQQPGSLQDDRTVLLTDGSKKSWYLYSQTPEMPGGTCQASHAISADNTYTFFADGSFDFNHGEITEDPSCEGEDCCSDIVNVVGSWRFTSTGKGLVVMAAYEKGNPNNKLATTLFSGTIALLSSDAFKISSLDTDSNVRYVSEFRKK